MQDVKPSSLCQVESDHQRETAQISADPSSAFDGDGEPRFDAARSSGERLHWRCHHEGECVRFREGPMPACSGTCLMLAESRPSGVETVREELLAEQPLMRILADAARCTGNSIEPKVASEGERLSLLNVDAELTRAGRLFARHARVLADHYKSAPAVWAEQSPITVRAWVAVAREAARS
jgi:hypothetical protein